ncbi:MAG: hypothetical protein C4530_24630 [Desulfobacteraceae bacterium]|nr:MAG: hypothetical protein C4530_24630 [Desulfobacteraceae bacterium]
MNDNKRPLYLYEALELRSEYDARIKTLRDCLPETKQNRERFSFSRDEGIRRASADFDAVSARKELKKIEIKRRKLNSAIQKANFSHFIDFHGDSINLSEALEIRKSLNEQIGELHNQVVNSSYQKVIYKEGRDIVEENEISYMDAVKNLDEARFAFRGLNRKLRLASFETLVEFQDE